MTLIQPDNVEELRLRRERMLLAAEDEFREAAGAAMRSFLRRIVAAFDDAATVASLAAAADYPFDDTPHRWLNSMGNSRGWWEEELQEHVTSAVGTVWRAGYFDTRDGELVTSSLDASRDYIARVTDRLSRTAQPTIPDQAMDRARVALADEMARGSSMSTIRQRIAQDFSWDANATLSRDRLAEVTDRLDTILDGYGPVGSAEREAVRMGRALDPDVVRLQNERAEHVKAIDRVESEWQTRADRIARTETTGAYNAGSLQGAHEEGQSSRFKVWIATADDATRDSHLQAHGSCAHLQLPFEVGGVELDMPGDPAGPPEETINCRCTMVYADSCDSAQELFGRMDSLIDEERERREAPVPEQVPSPEVPAPEEATELPAGEDGYVLREDGLEHYDALDLADDDYRAAQGWDDDTNYQDQWSNVDDPARGEAPADLLLDLPADRQEAARDSVQNYQGGSYEKINRVLRMEPDRIDSRIVPERMGSTVDTVRRSTALLDEAIEAAPRVQSPVQTYRGITGDYAQLVGDAPVGSVLGDKGFLSTTLSRDVATSNFGGHRGRVMVIEMPRGTPAVYMNAQRNTIFNNELELLGARGAQMQVLEQTASETRVRIIGFAREVVNEVADDVTS